VCIPDIAGSVCWRAVTFWPRDAVLPAVAQGEPLASLMLAHTGMSLASNYNTRPRAAEVLVDGKRARLIRRRN